MGTFAPLFLFLSDNYCRAVLKIFFFTKTVIPSAIKVPKMTYLPYKCKKKEFDFRYLSLFLELLHFLVYLFAWGRSIKHAGKVCL